MRRQRTCFTLASFCIFAAVTSGQSRTSARPDRIAIDPPPTKTLDLSIGKPLTDLPAYTVIGSPVQCSATGTTYLDIYADSSSLGVSEFPQNYDRFIVLSTYANSDGLISLIEAREKKDLMDPKAAKARAFFIVTSKDDGSSTVPLQLDLKFTPRKLASLASGRFVILGIDDANITPILATLNSDGTLFRILDFDSRKYNKDSALKGVFNDQGATNSVTQRHMLAAVSFSMFVPFGSGVLFVQPASNLPARLIGDYGELKEVRFSTPAGYLMHDILVSDTKRPLVARLESEADLRSFAEKHVSENPD